MLITLLINATLLSAVPAALTLAQQSTSAAPPRARWVGTVIAAMLFACVVFASIKNPKRTHQD
jgi:hypothetical protein